MPDQTIVSSTKRDTGPIAAGEQIFLPRISRVERADRRNVHCSRNQFKKNTERLLQIRSTHYNKALNYIYYISLLSNLYSFDIYIWSTKTVFVNFKLSQIYVYSIISDST